MKEKIYLLIKMFFFCVLFFSSTTPSVLPFTIVLLKIICIAAGCICAMGFIGIAVDIVKGLIHINKKGLI